MQARYYDPMIGRFYSNDPVGYTAANPVMSFNRYMYVNNNPYKYIDPTGEHLVGMNYGVSGSVFGQSFSVSLSAAIDHNGSVQITVTPETGRSSQKFSGGAFIRAMYGGKNTTVDSLTGGGGSLSLSTGPISSSASSPALSNNDGIFIGLDASQTVYELGIGVGNKKFEFSPSFGHGTSYKSTLLGDLFFGDRTEPPPRKPSRMSGEYLKEVQGDFSRE